MQQELNLIESNQRGVHMMLFYRQAKSRSGRHLDLSTHPKFYHCLNSNHHHAPYNHHHHHHNREECIKARRAELSFHERKRPPPLSHQQLPFSCHHLQFHQSGIKCGVCSQCKFAVFICSCRGIQIFATKNAVF